MASSGVLTHAKAIKTVSQKKGLDRAQSEDCVDDMRLANK